MPLSIVQQFAFILACFVRHPKVLRQATGWEPPPNLLVTFATDLVTFCDMWSLKLLNGLYGFDLVESESPTTPCLFTTPHGPLL